MEILVGQQLSAASAFSLKIGSDWSEAGVTRRVIRAGS